MDLKPFEDFWSSERAKSFADSIGKYASDKALNRLEKTQNANIAILEASVTSSVKVTLDVLREYHDWLSSQLSE